MLKKRRNQIILGVFIALIAFGVWYLFIREIEAEDNLIAAPGLSQNVENPCAAPVTLADSTPSLDATAVPDEAPDVVAAPELIIDRSADEYRLYVFDIDASVINFTIAEAPSIAGTFGTFGHWFEFIYIPEQQGWCAVLWLDIDGNSVSTGNDIINTFMIEGFQAERYPVGRFVGAATTLISDLSVTNDIIMRGQIELTGVVRDLEVPVQIDIVEEQLIANASFLINANDFGANLPGGGASLDSKIRMVGTLTDPSIITIPVVPTALPSEPSE